MFDERYQIFGWTRKWSKATRFFVSMEELRTCYPLRSLCLKKCPCSLYQRRSRSVKGAFTCSFRIPRAADLPGANNSQTTPGIVGADRFSRCRFFIFRGYAGEICQLIDELLPLRKPIFLLFTSKELLLETSNALKFPHLAQYRNGDAANIKRRFDRGESSILLGTGSFWEGVDFSQQKK